MSDSAIADYTPRQIIEDDLGGMSLDEAMAATMVDVEDGQLVTGTVVKVDRDEVLLDIGYKSEGVIPAGELSIRKNVDTSEEVELGEVIVAAGLAANLAALRALATEGIQRGHMSLHARSIALGAGATSDELEALTEQLIASGEIKHERAIELLRALRATRR